MLDMNGIGSASDAIEITPSDTGRISKVLHAVYVGSAGDLVVKMNGSEVTFANAFGLLPISPSHIKASGTTASAIVGLW